MRTYIVGMPAYFADTTKPTTEVRNTEPHPYWGCKKTKKKAVKKSVTAKKQDKGVNHES
jgi:hypothetical protein